MAAAKSRTHASSRTASASRSRKVARWGNSLALRIPQEVAEHLKLTDGGEVSVELRAGSFVVTPKRKRWSEADLLKGVTPQAVGGELNWGKPLGKEI